MSIDYHTTFQEVRTALANNDAKAAFSKIRPLLSSLSQNQDEQLWREAFKLFAQISPAYADARFVEKVGAVAENPDNVQGLYDLGYHLIEQGLSDIAAEVLIRAHQFAPEKEIILTEMSSALERTGRYLEAVHYLKQSPTLVSNSFTCRYLLAYNSVMSGDLDEPRRLMPGLLQAAQGDNQKFMAATIEGMVKRADAIKGVTSLDKHDLRGWHFVITGGILLHLSPHGPEVMNGRYAYIQDNPALMLEGIMRLKAVLESWGTKLPRLLALPDRDSRILAQAAGQILGCEVITWPEGGTDAPGLIVAYDLHQADMEVLGTFFQHAPGQLLWSHASTWTEDAPFASDLTTFLHQVNMSYWAGGSLVVNPETAQIERKTTIEGSPEELAEQIVNASLEPEALKDLASLTSLAKAATSLQGSAAAGAFLQTGRRRRQWQGGPVASNRFTGNN